MRANGSKPELDHVALRESGVLRSCPICNGRRSEVLHHQDFATPRELAAPAAYDVVACRRCGLVYADQAVEQTALDADYETHSIYALEPIDAGAKPSAAGFDGSDVHADAPWDLQRLSGVAAYLGARIPKDVRVLDAGCANGSFLHFMRKEGFTNLVGLDPSFAAIAGARTRYGVDAVAGSFLRPPDGLGHFDLIVLSHTLEHIADVGRAIGSLRALLRPNGMAYIEVPDASRYADYLVAPFHDFNTEHINHFSLHTLRTLMNLHAFSEADAGRKTVRNSPTDDYPAVFGVWRPCARELGAGNASSLQIERDDGLVAAAKDYVRESRVLMRQIDGRLRHDLAGHDDVIVWGAGQLTMKLLRDTVLREKRVAAVIDSSAQRQGLHLDRTRVVAPSALHDLPRLPIVVGSLHSEVSIVERIRRDLRLRNPVIRLFRRTPPADVE